MHTARNTSIRLCLDVVAHKSSRMDFDASKSKILEGLRSTEVDASPKGHPDAPIFPLLDLINAHEDLVTTSSCSGRVAVYVDAAAEMQEAGGHISSKGTGGRWTCVRHEPFSRPEIEARDDELLRTLFGSDGASAAGARYQAGQRLVHFKFEPMVRGRRSELTQ